MLIKLKFVEFSCGVYLEMVHCMICLYQTEKEFLDYRLSSTKLVLKVANMSSGEFVPFSFILKTTARCSYFSHRVSRVGTLFHT